MVVLAIDRIVHGLQYISIQRTSRYTKHGVQYILSIGWRVPVYMIDRMPLPANTDDNVEPTAPNQASSQERRISSTQQTRTPAQLAVKPNRFSKHELPWPPKTLLLIIARTEPAHSYSRVTHDDDTRAAGMQEQWYGLAFQRIPI